MTNLEVLFLFDEPLNKNETEALDTWVGGSPWAHKPGTFTYWAISYGPIPETHMQAKALVVVGAKAARWVLDQDGIVTYTSGANPRPKKLDPKLVNRVFKPTKISGFGSFEYLLVLKTAGQLMMSARFAEQSGFPVRPAGTKNTVNALWSLYMAINAKPVVPQHD